MTEQIGDILITCSGGSFPAGGVGSVITTANITVSLATNVTSRIIGFGGVNASEALLMIDEPGSGILGPLATFGPNAPQTTCVTPLGAGPNGCPEVFQIVNGLPVAVPASPGQNVFPGSTAANMFIGTVNANQVTFFGVPILPPVSAGTSRVFRITNVRANVSGLGSAGLAGTTQLVASISISGATSLPVNNPVQIAGFVQAGLSVGYNSATGGNLSSGGTAFNQCNTQTTSGVATLHFTENFGTAFKTRVAPTAAFGSGQAGIFPNNFQNIPGFIYNSESGFITNFATGQGSTGGVFNGFALPGLADYGTRLKAVFNSVPAGVRLFVSVTNLANNATNATTPQPTSGNNPTSFALLVTGEATPDGNGTTPTPAPTGAVNGSPGTTAIFEIPVVNGSATAVWEVVNTNPAAIETFNFGVWTSYSANPANNSPALGTATVNLSYAPTPPNAGFTAAQGSVASAGPIPRFADLSTARNILVINICQTLLLYPFVTNQNGFDTGLSIANTSTDPLGTTTQNGTCKLTWYDGSGKFPATGINGTDLTKEPAVATGTVAVNLVSVLAPNFQGYMFALCNFQYAHGFAFISDVGARNLAMGYLALVVNNGTISRGPTSETLGN
ncbi:MAG: hypothetical protein LAQ69_33335 [Acidobacteriia bacterium]|nr:hypothetical protein [Terriglobia bacterium]